MKINLALLLFIFSIGCAHQQQVETLSEAERTPSATLWTENDREMRSGNLDIWILQKMAEEKKFDELNKLFNRGRSMKGLPTGYSAGTGARVLGLESPVGNLLDAFTGRNWKGKYFYQENRHKSHGLNRIRRSLTIPFQPIVLMGNFTTELLDNHPLVPEAKSNLVILNYAEPVTKNFPIEMLLTRVQVYDVMIAVPGKYGPVYIGKTWLGQYDKNTKYFVPKNDKVIAWFFLDFSQEAFEEQKRNHWDRSTEFDMNGRKI